MDLFKIFVLLCLASLCEAGLRQWYQAVGKIECNGAPFRNVCVRLVDHDSGWDPEDELEAGFTNWQGRYNLKGSTIELTPIDPRLEIYHKCKKSATWQKWTKVTIILSKDFITKTAEEENPNNLELLDMQDEFEMVDKNVNSIPCKEVEPDQQDEDSLYNLFFRK